MFVAEVDGWVIRLISDKRTIIHIVERILRTSTYNKVPLSVH